MSEIPSEPMRPGSLTLEQARKIVDAMVEYATTTKPGRSMAFAVVDECGVLMYLARMPQASLINRQMAEKKAWSAIAFKRDTRATGDLLAKMGLKAIDFCEPDRLTLIPGGNLIRTKEGFTVGAVGTSGRHYDEDEELALVGVKAYEQS
ncbi:MAG: heme-binding protein [Dehalococcoidia bacterium]|nr:heme-binding protein [Dehalococcoidia bacterium]